MADKSEIIRLNRILSFKIIRRCKAKHVTVNFEIDPTHHNHYYVLENAISYEEPKMIRSNVYHLKSDIPESFIYVMSLQSTETKLIKNKNRKEAIKEEPTLEFIE